MHHREVAGDVGEKRCGILDATCHGDGADDDDRQGKEHEAALHEVGRDDREITAHHRVEEYDDGTEDHHDRIVHAKERVEELAASDEAAARVDAEEDEDDDGGNRAHDVLVIVKAIGIETGQRDRVVGLFGIAAQALGDEQPVEVGAECQADARPTRVGGTGEVGEAGQTHEQVARHVRCFG